MSTGPTFLITGATGYLGSHLLRALHEAGHRVVILKRTTSDVRRVAELLPMVAAHDIDREPLDAVFRQHAATCVLHCATDYGRGATPIAALVDTNLGLPLRLAEAAISSGVQWFINIDTALDARVSDYALSKRQFREWLPALATSLGVINLVLEHFYGPGDDETKFVGAMMRRMAGADTRIALTPGDQVRDFIFIDDVVEAIVLILAHHVTPARAAASPGSAAKSPCRYEIGSGQAVSIRHFMTLLQRLAGRGDVSLDFGALPYRPHEVMHSEARIAPLQALGWRPRFSLEDGLRLTLAAEKQSQ